MPSVATCWTARRLDRPRIVSSPSSSFPRVATSKIARGLSSKLASRSRSSGTVNVISSGPSGMLIPGSCASAFRWAINAAASSGTARRISISLSLSESTTATLSLGRDDAVLLALRRRVHEILAFQAREVPGAARGIAATDTCRDRDRRELLPAGHDRGALLHHLDLLARRLMELRPRLP